MNFRIATTSWEHITTGWQVRMKFIKISFHPVYNPLKLIMSCKWHPKESDKEEEKHA